MDLEELTQEIVEFRDERDWEQFHTPKELAAAISIEAAEIQELFLWKSATEARDALQKDIIAASLREEAADVLIFALFLCHDIDADPTTAIKNKLKTNKRKYPAELAKGRSDKYTDLSDELEDDGQS